MNRAIVAIALASFLTLPAVAQETIQFERNYPPGDYTMTQTITGTGEFQMGGKAQTQSMEMTMVTTMKVAAPDARKVTKIEMRFERIRQEIRMGSRAVLSYDSTSAAATQPTSPTDKLYGALLGTVISFDMGPDGKVDNIRGFDEMWDKLAKEDPAMAGMANRMKTNFGKKMVEQMSEQIHRALPEKPVQVGETWETPLDIPMPTGTMKMSAHNTLKEIQKTPAGELAVIAITGGGKIQANPQATSMPAGVDMEFTQSGTQKVDVKNPLVSEGNFELVIEGQPAQASSQPASAPATSIKQVMKVHVISERTPPAK